MISRRTFNFAGLSAVSAFSVPVPALAQAPAAAKPANRLVLTGTKAGPRVGGSRANPSNLLLLDGVPFVVDCGYGTARSIVNAGVRLPDVRYIFITHQHSDHNLDYGNIVNAAWSAGLNAPVSSFGPKGMQAMTDLYWQMNRFDVETRMADEGKPDPRKLLVASDIEEGVVLELPGIKVSAIRVPHPPVVDSFAFKFETKVGTIVFSGDTAYSEKLAEFAKGCDILVHEALFEPGIDKMVARVPFAQTLKKHLMDSHTKTDDIGRVAKMAQPKLLVLSHLVPGDDPTITDEMWLEGVKTHYEGKAVVAKDQMAIELPLA
jgi:ribonuclease BN (tRNA processing enzyme)